MWPFKKKPGVRVRAGKSSPPVYKWEPRRGVELCGKVLSSIEAGAAEAEAAILAEGLRRGAEAAIAAGLDGGDYVNDDALRESAARFLLSVEYGLRSLTSIEGFFDSETGKALPLDRNFVFSLFQDRYYAEGVTSRALAPFHYWSAEGNASAVSPNGGDGAAESTATAAAPSEAPAPPAEPVQTASSAPKSRTSRRRQKAP